jgi:hypothetical protein
MNKLFAAMMSKVTTRLTQEKFDKLSELMYDKGVVHEAFELLADLRQSERLAYEEATVLKHAVIDELGPFSKDYEGLPPNELNYLQCIRRLVKEKQATGHDDRTSDKVDFVRIRRDMTDAPPMAACYLCRVKDHTIWSAWSLVWIDPRSDTWTPAPKGVQYQLIGPLKTQDIQE